MLVKNVLDMLATSCDYEIQTPQNSYKSFRFKKNGEYDENFEYEPTDALLLSKVECISSDFANIPTGGKVVIVVIQVEGVSDYIYM